MDNLILQNLKNYNDLILTHMYLECYFSWAQFFNICNIYELAVLPAKSVPYLVSLHKQG